MDKVLGGIQQEIATFAAMFCHNQVTSCLRQFFHTLLNYDMTIQIVPELQDRTRHELS
jgi:hypothetical protein